MIYKGRDPPHYKKQTTATSLPKQPKFFNWNQSLPQFT